MVKEVSAGGVVTFGNTILLLKRFNGDWVLPKGRVKKNEEIKNTALREVFEETGVKAEIIKYIDEIHYDFTNIRGNEIINKTVHWFLMSARNMECTPQKEEGFIEAKFVHIDRAENMLKYLSEKKITIKAIDEIKNSLQDSGHEV
ncbi:MAG: NUDIX hydrolase [Clostridiaceae bacterium]|nr:NUDIX hydrolase [Clostridiaceae bacterium]MBW4858472.1 NUDIX hydrolase [Clostridiaceae bacterium]MBW4868845.1 NUDIX hydrolase [Clostridiaceae bacterium]